MLADLEDQLGGLRGRETAFAPEQRLFNLGDPVKVIYLVREGAIQLLRYQADGSFLVLQRAGPGAILAEASLYSKTYHCDAIALVATRTLVFSKREIRTRLTTNPNFSEAWARHLANEVQRARLQAEILSLKTVAARFDAWVAWNDGAEPQKGEWKVIAGQIGVSPEALYRELAKRR